MRSYKERQKSVRRYNFLVKLLEDLRDEYVFLVTARDTNFYDQSDKLTDLENKLAFTKSEVMYLHRKLNGSIWEGKEYQPRVEFHWQKEGKKGVISKHGHSRSYTKAVEAYRIG